MNKIGLKLWSVNTDYYFDEAKELYEEGFFDYIELYVVPDTLNSIKKWKTIGIPFTLHAPHFRHDVNLAYKEKEDFNKKIFKQVKQFNEELNAEYVVIHGGMAGNIDETIRQLNLIDFDNKLIENKPYKAPIGDNRFCRGANIKEIQKVLKNVGCGFCLDIGHAICSANSFELEPYKFLEEFNSLNPTCYHLSDNFIDSTIDGHMHFCQGNYDIPKILHLMNKDRNIAIETNKASKISLEDFKNDVIFLRKILSEV